MRATKAPRKPAATSAAKQAPQARTTASEPPQHAVRVGEAATTKARKSTRRARTAIGAGEPTTPAKGPRPRKATATARKAAPRARKPADKPPPQATTGPAASLTPTVEPPPVVKLSVPSGRSGTAPQVPRVPSQSRAGRSSTPSANDAPSVTSSARAGDGPQPTATSGPDPTAGQSRAPKASRAAHEEPPVDPPSADDLADAISDAARDTFGESVWERRLLDLVAFARRRLSGDYAVDEFGFDPEITERFVLSALRPLATKWFRIEVRGVENIPATGGALVVSNHSGTVPVDCMMTALMVHDHAQRFLRPLGADLVFALPFFGELARKGGATLASTEDAERMLARGDLVGVWPEGFKGIGKAYSERYKLQRFGSAAHRRTHRPVLGCRR